MFAETANVTIFEIWNAFVADVFQNTKNVLKERKYKTL